ncbi:MULTISPECIES: flagellar biosynthetic protein FliO [unclassified Legionella]|uniref:flagellar biosynthetic protein FliO n=1 Tax=unclassified Legionella TaxID=2622702 RepID=UPI001056966B|nr:MULTISPECIES: flagellar biosynthetic protein FliO [unclassified Legionella]MDI9817631.1 flagellar biosynthetic protein FliO [Legionella sp. PL877]
MRLGFYLFFGLFPLTTWADLATKNSSSLSHEELLRVIGGLLLVIALIIFLSWLLRRLNGIGLGMSAGFKVISTMSLGTKEKLMIVNAGNRFLLIGVTPNAINTLYDFGEELPADFSQPDAKASFAQILKKAIRKS